MRKYLTGIIITLLFSTHTQVKSATNDVILKAAVPVFIENFDWSLYSGGNDNNWASIYGNTLNDAWGNVNLNYCSGANMCICVGSSYAGDVTISGIPNSPLFITLRAGAYLDKEENSTTVNFDASATSSVTVYPNKFSNIRRSFNGTNSKGNIVISGDDNKYNRKFYIDDIVVYSVTDDIEKLKNTSRIVLAVATYTHEQIELLKEIVKENKNLTSIDLWSATVNEKFELEPGNPNCIIYDPNNYVTNTTNVAHCSGTTKDLNTYVCESLVIEDGSPFGAMYGFTAKNISYDRKFAQTGENYFSTMCLPFSLDKDNTKIHKLLSFTRHDSSNNLMVFDEASKIEANVPYVISVANEQPFIDLQGINADIPATSPRIIWEKIPDAADNATKERAKNCRLCGTYETRTDITSNSTQTVYGFSSGKFVKVEEGCTFNPFRAYITITDNNNPTLSKEMKLATSDGVVGIKNMKKDNAQSATTVYTTEGTLMSKGNTYKEATEKLTEGIYIINGKKTIIR